MAEDDFSLGDIQELEPLPENSPDLERGDYFSDEAVSDSLWEKPPPFAGSRVGLSGHRVEYWLSAIRKYSTGLPSVFLALHVTNTSLIPLITRSVPASESYLLLTRPIYQSPGLETIFLTAPIVVHITSGIALRYLRHRRRARLYGAETREQRREFRSWNFPSVQARLGYALVPLLGIHNLVNRIVPLYIDGGSSGVGLGYVAHGFARLPRIMTCYYVVFVGVGVWHVIGGWAHWMGWKKVTPRPRSRGYRSSANGGYLGSAAGGELLRRKKRRRRIVNGLIIAGAALWLAGGLGVVGRGGLGTGWEAKTWDAIYSRVPFLGRYLTAPVS